MNTVTFRGGPRAGGLLVLVAALAALVLGGTGPCPRRVVRGSTAGAGSGPGAAAHRTPSRVSRPGGAVEQDLDADADVTGAVTSSPLAG